MIQHRRQRLTAPAHAWRSRRGPALRRLAVGYNFEVIDHIRVVDFEGRCAIEHDTQHDGRGRRPLV